MTLNWPHWGVLLTGTAIFLARLVDVTLGTLRTISVVNGRKVMAFVVGFVEVSIWLAIISTVVLQVHETPFLGVCYALGCSTGNVLGIWLERRLAMGATMLEVVTQQGDGKELAQCLRDKGYGLTVLEGQGRDGPVSALHIVCLRRDLRNILQMVRQHHEDAFYVIKPGSASHILRPSAEKHSGWRSIFKLK